MDDGIRFEGDGDGRRGREKIHRVGARREGCAGDEGFEKHAVARDALDGEEKVRLEGDLRVTGMSFAALLATASQNEVSARIQVARNAP